MAFIPYMAAGYAADRLMGGSGLKGAALGAGGYGLFSSSGLGLGSELFGLGSEVVPASTGLEIGSSAMGSLEPTLGTLSTELPATYGLDMTSGLAPVDLGASDALLGSYINPTMSQFAINTGTPLYTNALNAPLGEFGLAGPLSTQAFAQEAPLQFMKPLAETASKGFDFINQGWGDMSFADKAGSLNMTNQAVDTLTAPQTMIQPPQAQVARGKETSISQPVAINVPRPGVSFATYGQLQNELSDRQKRALGLL